MASLGHDQSSDQGSMVTRRTACRMNESFSRSASIVPGLIFEPSAQLKKILFTADHIKRPFVVDFSQIARAKPAIRIEGFTRG